MVEVIEDGQPMEAVKRVFELQADAVVSQANPVTATKYTVLDTTKNVRIISIAAKITWAVTQPTPIVVTVTIDGVSYIFGKTDPVTATSYYPAIGDDQSEATAGMSVTGNCWAYGRPFMLEGRSVKVEIEVTWATTQPTPLVCRVKYAKIP